MPNIDEIISDKELRDPKFESISTNIVSFDHTIERPKEIDTIFEKPYDDEQTIEDDLPLPQTPVVRKQP